jgi:hypothetical protein
MRNRGGAFWFLNVCALWTAVNGIVADWNHSHLFNPQWTPHAKYHDAVSISAHLLLGVAALVYLWRPSKQDLDFALVLMSIAWAALLLGFAFPGTAQTAAEHPEVVPHIGALWLNEVFIATTSEGATLIAWIFERRRRQRR